jgi:hypothetical protein
VYARPDAHKRSTDNIAGLALGFEYWLRFALASHAITEERADALRREAQSVFREIGAAQVQEAKDSQPVRRYLDLLKTLLSSGRAHVTDADGCQPLTPQLWGWRQTSAGTLGRHWQACGDHMGWTDGQNVYLDADACYAAMQKFLHESGENLGLGSKGVGRALADGGLLLGVEEERRTYRIRKTLQGARRAVLWLRSEALWGEISADQSDH